MEISNGSYTFNGGGSALDIVEKFGCPIYVYDTSIIKRKYDRLTNAFNGQDPL